MTWHNQCRLLLMGKDLCTRVLVLKLKGTGAAPGMGLTLCLTWEEIGAPCVAAEFDDPFEGAC